MANSLPRYIVLTMLASFLISFAFMFWQRTNQDRPMPTLVSTPIMAVYSGPAVRAAPTAATIDRGDPSPPAARTATGAEYATADPASGEAAPAAELPIAFHIRNQRDLNRIDGDIRNISSLPMTITLRAVSSSTQGTSEVHFELAPGQRGVYSSDTGLYMQADDQLIVSSPPFRDRVVKVP